MSDMNIKLFTLGSIIALASLWLGCYTMSFATPNNSWFVYPALMTMAAGIIGGMAMIFKACNE